MISNDQHEEQQEDRQEERFWKDRMRHDNHREKPKWGLARTPTQDPASAMANQIQPCMLPDAVPARKAPMLQPKARRATIPMSRPPMAAASNYLRMGYVWLRSEPTNDAQRPAPINSPVFINERVSASTKCASACAGPGHCQKS